MHLTDPDIHREAGEVPRSSRRRGEKSIQQQVVRGKWKKSWELLQMYKGAEEDEGGENSGSRSP